MSYTIDENGESGSSGNLPASIPEFTVGRISRNTWFALNACFGTILILSLLAYVPTQLIAMLLEDPTGVYTTVLSIMGSLIALFAQGAVAYAVFRHREGASVSISKTLNHGARRFIPMLLASLLIGIAIFVVLMIGAAIAYGLRIAGLGHMSFQIALVLLTFFPALALYLQWVLAIPAAAVENIGPIQAMRRSAQLTKGLRWKMFIPLLMLFALLCGAATIIESILEIVFWNPYVAHGTVIALVIAAELALLPLIATMYYEARLTKGEFSQDRMASVVD